MRQIPLNRLADTLGSTLDKTVRVVKIELFNGVISDTRVDTGRLRGSWQTTSGAPASGDIEREDKTPQGSNGGPAQDDVIATVKGDTVDYLTNNLPYSEIYEEKDGMISRNVARLERNIKEAVSKNR